VWYTEGAGGAPNEDEVCNILALESQSELSGTNTSGGAPKVGGGVMSTE